MKNKLTSIVTGLVLLAFSVSGANKSQASGFQFSYNVGTAVGYHAYAYAANISNTSRAPAGTVLLGASWVWDLGPVSGIGTVVCPTPLKKYRPFIDGQVFFATVDDLGGGQFASEVPNVIESAGIETVELDGPSSDVLYAGPILPNGTVFDLTIYLPQ